MSLDDEAQREMDTLKAKAAFLEASLAKSTEELEALKETAHSHEGLSIIRSFQKILSKLNI